MSDAEPSSVVAALPRRRRVRRVVLSMAAVVSVLVAVAATVWFAVLPSYRPALHDGERYGIDVSHHQGRVDWRAVADDGISFAYLKATEGGDHVDSMFDANRRAARAAGLRTGAYHFFTFCQTGTAQAANYLRVLGDDPDALPPAVDLEDAGNCSRRPPAAQLRAELGAFIDAVQRATGRRVVLYVLDDTEHRYRVRANRTEPLWPRRFPLRPSGDRWVIWQLHGFAHVDGVAGRVDLDVADLGVLDASTRTDVRP